jgi:hypothetical protein
VTDFKDKGVFKPQEPEVPASPLLARLLAESDKPEIQSEWRRADPRKENLSGTRLELRRSNGATHTVRLHNVSRSGMCVICPKRMRVLDVVSVRRQGDTGPFEEFKILHVTSTVGGFKLGMILNPD